MAFPIIPIVDVTQVSAGKVTAVTLPQGPTYRGLMLKITSGSSTAVTNVNKGSFFETIKLKIDGEDVWSLKGSDFYTIMKAQGLMSSVAGIFTLPFARRDFTLFDSEDGLALGTANLNVISVELGLASGVNTPTLEVFAEIDGRQLPFLPFLYLSSTTYDAPASTGERDITNLPVLGNNRRLKAVHFTTDDIKKVKLYGFIGGSETILIDAPRDVLGELIKSNTARAKSHGHPTDMTSIDFSGERLSGAVDMAGFSSIRATLDMSSATSMRAIMEIVKTPQVTAR